MRSLFTFLRSFPFRGSGALFPDRVCAIKSKIYIIRLSKNDRWTFCLKTVAMKMAILRIIGYVPRRPYVPRRRNIFFMDHGFNYRTFVCSLDYRKIRLLVSTDYRNIRLLVSNIKSFEIVFFGHIFNGYFINTTLLSAILNCSEEHFFKSKILI